MVRVLVGNEYVGVQGIYYFKDHDSAHEFGELCAPFLNSLRAGNSDYLKILEKYKDNEMLYNFFLKMKERVEEEDDNQAVWWEPGGQWYGTKWANEDLPNGRGVTLCGGFTGEVRMLDEDFDSVYI